MNTNKTFPRMILAASLLVWAIQSRAASPVPPGVPNFHQVTERIFRGAQPEERAWEHIAKLGVKTVIDLRRPLEHSTGMESLAVVAAGMRYVNFPMNGFGTPTADQMATVLPLLDGPENVFVHCKLGCDRTGTVIAAYRISRQRWENAKALAEAKNMGLHWYEAGMKRFIAGYRAEPGVTPIADAKLAGAPLTSAEDSTVASSELAR